MSDICLHLPAGSAYPGQDSLLSWLLDRIEHGAPGFANSFGPIRIVDGDSIAIAGSALSGHHAITLSPGIEGSRDDDAVPISVDLALLPADPQRTMAFLQRHWRTIDHIGLNLSDRDIDQIGWDALVADIGNHAQAYRLNIGSANDIVMVVKESPHGQPSVLELVHDRSAPRSSFHICACLDAPRSLIEDAFPYPYGGYKRGDEPFFRSAAIASSLRMPVFIDLAFSDGGMTPWLDIVQKLGTRII